MPVHYTPTPVDRIYRVLDYMWLRALVVQESDVITPATAMRLGEVHLVPQTKSGFAPPNLPAPAAEFRALLQHLATDDATAGLRAALKNLAHPALHKKPVEWLFHPLEVPGRGTVIAVVFGEADLITELLTP